MNDYFILNATFDMIISCQFFVLDLISLNFKISLKEFYVIFSVGNH